MSYYMMPATHTDPSCLTAAGERAIEDYAERHGMDPADVDMDDLIEEGDERAAEYADEMSESAYDEWDWS